MSTAAQDLQSALRAQPAPDCAALTSFAIEDTEQVVFLGPKLWGADGKLAVHATATAAVPPAQPSQDAHYPIDGGVQPLDERAPL